MKGSLLLKNFFSKKCIFLTITISAGLGGCKTSCHCPAYSQTPPQPVQPRCQDLEKIIQDKLEAYSNYQFPASMKAFKEICQ